MNKFFKLFEKHESKIKFLLIIYAIYCSFIIGLSWDEGFYQEIGKINLNYLLSFGLLDESYFSKFRYSTLYWSLSSLITQSFPSSVAVEVFHLVNTIFGLLTIIGLYKVVKKLLNKQVARISSLILFFTPFFFGHLAINNKDIILSFSHVWITYYIIKYSFKEYFFNKRFIILFKIATLCALGTGIQLLFLGSLLPIIFVFIMYLLLNKIKDYKKFLGDFALFFIIFYFILILFWVDTHENIFTKPLEFFFKSFSESVGWPFNLVGGKYILSHETPLNYLLINYLYKLPEFVIFLYFLSIPIIFWNFSELKRYFTNFKVLFFIFLILLVYPNLVIFLIPFPIYDGIRLFLWSTPYLAIIPAIIIYIIFRKKNIFFDISKFVLIFLFVFHFKNFLSITPYHYTFLNSFNGNKEFRYQKFENDYWSTSLKELILNSNLNDKKITFVSCGVSPELTKIYMKKKYKMSEYKDIDNAKYIIMTNRTMLSKKKEGITNCFDEFNFKNISEVKRNGIILSAIKKMK